MEILLLCIFIKNMLIRSKSVTLSRDSESVQFVDIEVFNVWPYSNVISDIDMIDQCLFC